MRPAGQRKGAAILNVGKASGWLVIAIFAGGLALLYVISGWLGILGLPDWLAIIGLFPLMWLTQHLVIRGITRQVQELEHEDFFVCTTCGYKLHGLSSSGRCPECGEPYAHAELRRRWLKAIDDEAGEPKLNIPDRHIARDIDR